MTTTTGIFIGIVIALVLVLISVAGFRQIDTCEDHDWVPIVIIEGIFFTGLLAGLFGSFGHETEKEEKVNIAIKTTVNANYNDVVNFHNDDTMMILIKVLCRMDQNTLSIMMRKQRL